MPPRCGPARPTTTLVDVHISTCIATKHAEQQRLSPIERFWAIVQRPPQSTPRLRGPP